MFFNKELETQVDDVFHANSVQKAGEVIRSKSGTVVLAIISFIESALPVPILTDPFLVAAILVDRTNVARLVIVATVSSVVGGLFAYFTAVFFIETVQGLLSPVMISQFQSMLSNGDSSTFMLTLVGAVTPIPYTLSAWVVALIKGGVGMFILASVLGRGLRYSIVGYSVYKFGPAAVKYAKRYMGFISIILMIAVIAYFLI